MRARHVRRAAPIALLASLTLISTPGVSFADPAPAPQQNVQVRQAAAQDEKPLDEQIAEAEKALENAKKQAEDTKRKLDNTTAEHNKAKQATADARDKLAKARDIAADAEARLHRAEERVDAHSGFSFAGVVDSVLSLLGSDITNSMSREVDDKRDAVSDAEKTLGKAEREETKAERAKVNAEKAHEQATAKQDEKQSELDKLNERKQAEEAPADGGAAPAAAPDIVKPAEGTFTSGYGARWGTTHYGVDIANSIGTPIYSAMSGTVISSGPASGFGLWVRVQHDNGLITVYGHINESLVSVGQRVEAGQQIATIGNRGQSTGPHLHFEIHENGVKIDPLPWLEAHGITL
ncbi:M23 family metallopeptidase [Saccharomonospora glauca]|jgi:murein DD-endopeptidase MepM/ murein hydrolase activator NlpD|uniref:Metalloendopeptidase-like membrane protein n=1 Tax=Saccharomonospora glauca K62 TaxID=928724 RepID=I1D6H0_9PSEU|nr:M23 family metallopeptidase [Saccharomonospora glauca]EIF00545.1 metalloendopeptidase-like membrane protein [Saccharomonospora glauca K62]